MGHRGVLVLAGACWLGATTLAAAAPTASAAVEAAIDNSDYPGAQQLVIAAIGRGDNGPSEMIELYRLQGIVESSLGNTTAAIDAFRRCLALAPSVTLPAGTSPKITSPFAAAKASNVPLAVKVETRAIPPAVTLIVSSDPLQLVVRTRVSVIVDGAPEQRLEGTGTIALPPGARLDLRIAALDARGNRLVEIGTTEVPLVIVSGARDTPAPVLGARPPPPPPAPPVASRPVYLRWWLWTGGALAFAGAGAGFGFAGLAAKGDLEDLNAASAVHDFDEAREVESTMRTRFVMANISYGLAIACGVTAGILFLTEPRRTIEQRGVSITPTVIDGGGALVLSGAL